MGIRNAAIAFVALLEMTGALFCVGSCGGRSTLWNVPHASIIHSSHPRYSLTEFPGGAGRRLASTSGPVCLPSPIFENFGLVTIGYPFF